MMAPLVRRSWAPQGQTPLLYQRTDSWSKVSAIAALAVSPARDDVRLYFRLHPDTNLTATLILPFLQDLKRELQEPLVLIWDRLPSHRAAKIQDWIKSTADFHTDFLPPYAPELNPVEYLWSYLKMNPLANHPIPDVFTLADLTRRHGRSLQHQPILLRSFINHSPLSLRLR